MKHRAMLFLTYSSGLRVSEVVRLKLTDFDWDRGTISIRQGKGKKDRHTLLSRTAWELVQQYVKLEKPSVWLFPGQYPGTHLHERSLQKVLQKHWHAPASRGRSASTCFDTPLLPIYSKTVLTSGLSKNCWATPTLPPPSATPMSAQKN